jgi:hypothetical protein
MKATIKGTKLNNGNFMIELDAEQLDNLAVYFLIDSCKWETKLDRYDGDSEIQRKAFRSLSDKYYEMYNSIKEIQGADRALTVSDYTI